MTFEGFISWAEQEIKDWREFETLGEVKLKREGKALRRKCFIAKYNAQQEVMLWKKPWHDGKDIKPKKLNKEKVRKIFERFMEASPAEKITSSYFNKRKWPEVPNIYVTPAIAAIIWHWYDTNRK